MKGNNPKTVSLLGAISIGIGGMVGGGIFAVLGLAVSLAQGGTPLSFLFAGMIALLTAYSYAKLSLAFPDRGGTVRFIEEGFTSKTFKGGVNNLLWICYIIMISLYASAFGSYAPNLLSLTGHVTIDKPIFATAIILIATLINYYSVKVVSQIESIAVLVKLVILLLFVFIGVYALPSHNHLEQLSLSHWQSPFELLVGGMVIFVAYEGFELIANAVPDLKNPQNNVPKAYFIAVIFVILLYLAISIVTVGSLSFDSIAQSEDYVLAEAAKPMVGYLGFTIITLAALISTFSAINASLYGGSRVNYVNAKDKELPKAFTDLLWHQPIGLFLTMILTILVVNTLNLESISTAGSVGFLLIFGVVNWSAFRLRKKIGSHFLLTLAAAFVSFLSLLALLIQRLTVSPIDDIIALSIIVACFLLEFIYQKFSHKSR